jgi:hypothetical protein
MSKKKPKEHMIAWRLFGSGLSLNFQDECATLNAARFNVDIPVYLTNYDQVLERTMNIQHAKMLEQLHKWSATVTHNGADHPSNGDVDFQGIGETDKHIFIQATVSGTQVRIADEGIPPEPPKVADFLLTVFASSSAKKDGIVGDINERFARECDQMGVSRARRRYWSRTLHTVWPLLSRAVAKAVKWGAVIEGVRRYF